MNTTKSKNKLTQSQILERLIRKVVREELSIFNKNEIKPLRESVDAALIQNFKKELLENKSSELSPQQPPTKPNPSRIPPKPDFNMNPPTSPNNKRFKEMGVLGDLLNETPALNEQPIVESVMDMVIPQNPSLPINENNIPNQPDELNQPNTALPNFLTKNYSAMLDKMEESSNKRKGI